MEADEYRNIPADWHRQSFNALYPVVYAHRTVEAARPESEFAADQLRLTSEDRVLDLCCGNGRHMVHLTRRTPHVSGLDWSGDLLAFARANVSDGRLVRGDMRTVPFVESFDALVSFFTSFGYFFTYGENRQVVVEMARALKPRGRFFIDYMNPRFVEKNLEPETVRQYNGYEIRERRWIDRATHRVNKHVEVLRESRDAGEWTESVRLYEEQEFRALIADGGLRVRQLFGNYDGSSVTDGEPRLIAVGQKV
jgi:SAM-dependent methyltransferase